jgi:hypothetical protein
MRWVEHVGSMGEMINAYTILLRKLQVKRHLDLVEIDVNLWTGLN